MFRLENCYWKNICSGLAAIKQMRSSRAATTKHCDEISDICFCENRTTKIVCSVWTVKMLVTTGSRPTFVSAHLEVSRTLFKEVRVKNCVPLKSVDERIYVSIWLLFNQFREKLTWQQSSIYIQTEPQPANIAHSFCFFFGENRTTKIVCSVWIVKTLVTTSFRRAFV